jgi:hypothetical protein
MLHVMQSCQFISDVGQLYTRPTTCCICRHFMSYFHLRILQCSKLHGDEFDIKNKLIVASAACLHADRSNGL